MGSEANAQHCVQVELGQAPQAPTQTKERLEKALTMLHKIERFACDQHDYVSFAKAWMLMSKGVAHALDYDLRTRPTGSDGSATTPTGGRAEANDVSAPWQ